MLIPQELQLSHQEHTAVVTAIVALGVANLDKQLSREGMYKE